MWRRPRPPRDPATMAAFRAAKAARQAEREKKNKQTWFPLDSTTSERPFALRLRQDSKVHIGTQSESRPWLFDGPRRPARGARGTRSAVSVTGTIFFQKFQMALKVLRTCFLIILYRLRAIAEKFFFECLLVRSFVSPYLSGTLLNLVRSS